MPDERKEEYEGNNDNGSDTLLIVLIVSVAAVAVAGIAAFTILKLKENGSK